jgi:hypothetical protein
MSAEARPAKRANQRARLKVCSSRSKLARMAKNPEPSKPGDLDSSTRLPPKPFGYTVKAADEATAIEKTAAEFKVPGTRLMAVGR